MSFLVYFFVLLVAASSVLFGLDWMQAPLQPPARILPATFAAAPAQPLPPAPSAPGAAEAKPAPVAPVALTGAPAADLPTGSTPSEAVKTEETEKPAPLCDIDACERAYRTFTAADCTYKPSFEGPRKLCTKGNPPRRPAAQNAAKEANAQARCNVSACESAYQSFDAATCTYQSASGGRRLCTK